MKAFRFLAVLIVVFSFWLPTVAAEQQCKPKDVLTQYLVRATVAADTTVLAFDHKAQDWQAFTWNGQQLGELKTGFTVDRKPVPPEARLGLGRKDELTVVVFDTNPMLYSVQVKPTTETDIPNVAEFKRLAQLLGGFVRSALGANTFSRAQPAPAPPPPPLPGEPPSREVLELEALGDSLETILLDLQEALAPRAAEVTQHLKDLRGAQEDIEKLADQLEAITFESRQYMRAVESGGPVNRTLGSIPGLDTLDSSIDGAAANLATLHATLAPPTCVKSYTAASAAISRKLRGFPEEDGEAEEDEFQANLEDLDQERMLVDRCQDIEIGVLERLREWLADHPPQTSRETADAAVLLRIKGTADRYVNFVARLQDLKAASADLLAGAPAAGKAAQELALLARREADSIDENEEKLTDAVLCSLSYGVIVVSPQDDPNIDPLKVQQRSFEVKTEALFAGDIVPRRANLEPKFEVSSARTAAFSLGFGVLYTRQVNPVWSAVSDPRESSPTEDTQKFIARTNEEKIAGTVALIASYTPGQESRRFRFGVDLGAGIDQDRPTGLLGVSVNLGRFARLGVGYGWTRIDVLQDGQSELSLLPNGEVDPASLTPVAATADIRTKEKYDGALYFSLTFSLNSLPFFAPEEEE